MVLDCLVCIYEGYEVLCYNAVKREVNNMKLFNETEGARNGSPIVEIVVYALVIFLLYTLL